MILIFFSINRQIEPTREKLYFYREFNDWVPFRDRTGSRVIAIKILNIVILDEILNEKFTFNYKLYANLSMIF